MVKVRDEIFQWLVQLFLDEKNEMISITYKKIKREFDLEIAENFKEEVKKNKIREFKLPIRVKRTEQ